MHNVTITTKQLIIIIIITLIYHHSSCLAEPKIKQKLDCYNINVKFFFLSA